MLKNIMQESEMEAHCIETGIDIHDGGEERLTDSCIVIDYAIGQGYEVEDVDGVLVFTK
jgi:hypothetical protein